MYMCVEYIIGERERANLVVYYTTGTIFLYNYIGCTGAIIGERERANLVVRLARFLIYYVSSDGAHFTYAHARNLRETPTRHVYPLPFERIRGLGGIMVS